MSMHNHPYTTLLLELTRTYEDYLTDDDSHEAFDIEGITREDFEKLTDALERITDVSYRDTTMKCADNLSEDLPQ